MGKKQQNVGRHTKLTHWGLGGWRGGGGNRKEEGLTHKNCFVNKASLFRSESV